MAIDLLVMVAVWLVYFAAGWRFGVLYAEIRREQNG
jgi:hypothetical protein